MTTPRLKAFDTHKHVQILRASFFFKGRLFHSDTHAALYPNIQGLIFVCGTAAWQASKTQHPRRRLLENARPHLPARPVSIQHLQAWPLEEE